MGYYYYSYNIWSYSCLRNFSNAETREMIVNEFLGHVRKLVKHKEACFVIDDAYSQFATPKQKAALVREFYGVEYALFKVRLDLPFSSSESKLISRKG